MQFLTYEDQLQTYARYRGLDLKAVMLAAGLHRTTVARLRLFGGKSMLSHANAELVYGQILKVLHEGHPQAQGKDLAQGSGEGARRSSPRAGAVASGTE